MALKEHLMDQLRATRRFKVGFGQVSAFMRGRHVAKSSPTEPVALPADTVDCHPSVSKKDFRQISPGLPALTRLQPKADLKGDRLGCLDSKSRPGKMTRTQGSD